MKNGMVNRLINSLRIYKMEAVIYTILMMLLIFVISLFVVSFKDGSIPYNVFPTLIIGLIGLIILNRELHAKRKLHEEDLKFRKEQQKIQERMQEGINLASERVASGVFKRLSEDTTWASSALTKARLGLRGQSLFLERMEHFKEEKEHLASKFVPLILKRCKRLIEENGYNVYLIIDSGTTLYPFFDVLGRIAVRNHEHGERWIDNLLVVTNNLAGLDLLIESGRINPNYRYSPLAINCYVLPGMPVPVYSAITGDVTNNAIRSLREKDPIRSIAQDLKSKNNPKSDDARHEFKKGNRNSKKRSFKIKLTKRGNHKSKTGFFTKEERKPYVISLLTGNWVKIKRHDPPYPVPLARGEGHRCFKQCVIDCSDEVFIISPLGKIFIDTDSQHLNKFLSLNNDDMDSEEYKEVEIDDKKGEYVKLVSTSRRHLKVLSKHSTRVSTVLRVNNNFKKEDFIKCDIKKVPHVLFQFDYYQDHPEFEIAREFPHPHTRTTEFMREYFHYPDAP